MSGRARNAKQRTPASAVGPGSKRAPNPAEATATGKWGRFTRIFGILGPGLITGASDDDPSGIGTYAAAGAALGLRTLWLALLTFPLMASVQFICAKVGMVSGRGLAGVLRKHYSKKLLYPALAGLVIANTINAGTDIGAIAAAINMFIPVPIKAMVAPIAAIILALQIWGSYRLIARTFKWLTLTLLAYIASAFFARPGWGEVLRATFIPSFQWSGVFLSTVVAILGTTISPYLFFWQASQEVEEEISRGHRRLWQRKGASDKELKYAAWDVNIGMLLSNVVMYFIILSTATTLNRAGMTDIQQATDAAEALRPVAGDAARVLLGLGLIGSGFLAVPVLTGCSAYAIAESFGWKLGLDKKLRQARGFYGIIAACTAAGLLVNFVGINPIKALFLTAVINGLLAPPLLAVVMVVSNNRKIMGDRTNGGVMNSLGWITTAIMVAAAIALLLTWWVQS